METILRKQEDCVNRGASSAYHSRYYFNIPINAITDAKIASNANNTLASINQYKEEIDDILFYNRVLTDTEITQIGRENNFCFSPNSSILSAASITNTIYH